MMYLEIVCLTKLLQFKLNWFKVRFNLEEMVGVSAGSSIVWALCEMQLDVELGGVDERRD